MTIITIHARPVTGFFEIVATEGQPNDEGVLGGKPHPNEGVGRQSKQRSPEVVSRPQASAKMQVSELNFTKNIVAATPDLLLAWLNDEAFSEVILTIQKAGESARHYFRIPLTPVRISCYSTSGYGTRVELLGINLCEAKCICIYLEDRDGNGADAVGPLKRQPFIENCLSVRNPTARADVIMDILALLSSRIR